jgi:hypothetical protein
MNLKKFNEKKPHFANKTEIHYPTKKLSFTDFIHRYAKNNHSEHFQNILTGNLCPQNWQN